MASYDVSKLILPNGDECVLKDAEAREDLDNAKAIVTVGPSAMVSVSDAFPADALEATVSIEPVQSGSGDPSPTNVRPISGWTGAKVTRCGKNFAEIDSAWIGSSGTHNGITWRFNEDGSMTLNGTKTTSTASILIWNFANAAITASNPQSDNKKHIPNGDYYIYSGHAKATLQVYGSNDENANQNNSYYIMSGNLSPAQFTINDTYKYNWIRLNIGGSAVFDNYTFYPMVQLASDTGTGQAPYIGTTYNISFPSEAGTVYGGTLDVTTGLLTVEYAKVLFDGTQNISKNTDSLMRYYNIAFADGQFISDKNVVSSWLKNSATTADTNPRFYQSNGSGNHNIYFANLDRIDATLVTADAVQAYFANNPLEVVYKLATPQTYQLSPTEVTLLLGDNNIWADTGDTTVAYLRDDSLCINRAIEALRLTTVTGIKGNAESSYRQGNVNLTAANIGAKPTQTAVSDPTASGTAVAFIDSITQNANGVITPTKKTVRSASQSESGLMSATDKAKLDGIIIMDSTTRTIVDGTSTVNVSGLTADHVVARWQFSGNYTDNYPPADITVTTSNGSYTITASNLMSEGITMQPIFIKP